MATKEIKLTQLRVNPEYDYKKADQKIGTLLVESIRKYGLQNPLRVIDNSDGSYTIAPGGGHARYRALQTLETETASVEIITEMQAIKGLMSGAE